ncbi:MAG: cytidyltransferase [Alkaliphilus sp.]|nr:cytidyltransferase [Alkaliphilus sp.]
MTNLKAFELYDNICDKFFNSEWLHKHSFSKDFIRKHLENDKFRAKLNTMVLNNDFSSQTVLELCQSLLNDLAGKEAPNDWLMYLYQFALYKSFPDATDIVLSKHLDSCSYLYLDLLKIISEFQKFANDGTWLSKFPLTFLTTEEESDLEEPTEYRHFIAAFEQDYIYEMMKLNQEVTGHNNIDHVCGVHYLAMFISRQLKKVGIPIDLSRVSGSTAGHDIGKYGCTKLENKRVPYLHYYYTDQWFKKHDMTYIGHIALNHSVWDLELENLSLESLILIYTDFRVKNSTDKHSNTSMNIFSLSDSFEVILNKLDNVDEIKKKRYKRVYSKLKDFEDYILHLGIEVNIPLKSVTFIDKHDEQTPNYALMQEKEVIENIKYLAINHNINLMHLLRDEHSLYAILEFARSEKDWRNLREYLRIFKEYSTYLTQKQKIITIKFLYEYLTHPEDDIRRYCALLIGSLIALFDEDYRKVVPDKITLALPEVSSIDLLDKYIQRFIFPDHKIISIHRSWIGNSFNMMISSLFLSGNTRKSMQNSKLSDQYISLLLKYYEKDAYENNNIEIYLLEALKHIPLDMEDSRFLIISDFIFEILQHENSPLRIAALEVINQLVQQYKNDCTFNIKTKNWFSQNINYSQHPSENFLKLKIVKHLNSSLDIVESYERFFVLDIKKTSDIFLSNLKTATDWITKKIQIEFLLECALNNPKTNALHTVIHFCNLLKVSSSDSVRNRSGEAILQIMPLLSFEQRNEVAIELLRALELDGHQFAEYIPYYLGQILLYLPPVELDELVEDLSEKIKQSNSNLSSLLLKTIGVTIANYPKYSQRFEENRETYNTRLIKMLGILLNGLVHYSNRVKQVAFRVLGRDVFGSRHLDLEHKNQIFQLTAKKILTLLTDKKEESLLFLVNAASLNHIYRFISDYVFFNGNISIVAFEKIAFFPGTFDAFSYRHKEIAKTVRDMGFEVYLAIDEFSWSKQTLPHLLRKNIINMSIADELNIYLYPNDFPTNISNPSDLRRLKCNFPNSEVHMVMGSDVILNASSYKGDTKLDSIHSFPHIIIERDHSLNVNSRTINAAIKKISGKILHISLVSPFQDISSTQIRNCIDDNRDITKLVDPLAQRYIYDNGFYKREPQYKTLTDPMTVNIEVIEDFTPDIISELASFFKVNFEESLHKLIEFSNLPSSRFVVIRDIQKNGKILGFSAHHWVRLNSLFQEFQDNSTSEYIREHSNGRICVIDGVFVENEAQFENLEQVVITETLAFCLSKDYEYAVFKNMLKFYNINALDETLLLQGFKKLPYGNTNQPVYVVNMCSPCTLNLDVENNMKEPFRSNSSIRNIIKLTRKKLQKSLTALYPGHLILSFDRDILYQTLIKKVCSENNVPVTQTNPRTLGPLMCVPFGNNILSRYIIPNTVTKTLHIEKLFASHMKDFIMGPFPHYPELSKQVKMIHSFDRPIILVDDILHKGYRINALDPILNSENVTVQKIIVGILSARGKELMDRQKRAVDCAYYIPKLRAWFNENNLYPFLGGDTLWRGTELQRNLVPSVNLILPYTTPTFVKNTSKSALYNFSKICIENAIELLLILEREYHNIHERNLTVASLGEVFVSPRCPDHGKNMHYDLNLNPSSYLNNDLEQLNRLEHALLD